MAAPVRNHVQKPRAVIVSSDEEDQLADDDDVVEVIQWEPQFHCDQRVTHFSFLIASPASHRNRTQFCTLSPRMWLTTNKIDRLYRPSSRYQYTTHQGPRYLRSPCPRMSEFQLPSQQTKTFPDFLNLQFRSKTAETTARRCICQNSARNTA